MPAPSRNQISTEIHFLTEQEPTLAKLTVGRGNSDTIEIYYEDHGNGRPRFRRICVKPRTTPTGWIRRCSTASKPPSSPTGPPTSKTSSTTSTTSTCSADGVLDVHDGRTSIVAIGDAQGFTRNPTATAQSSTSKDAT